MSLLEIGIGSGGAAAGLLLAFNDYLPIHASWTLLFVLQVATVVPLAAFFACIVGIAFLSTLTEEQYVALLRPLSRD